MKIQTLIATFLLTVSFAAPLAAQDAVAECDFDTGGQICVTVDGLYGNCAEDGPNSCDGENPDFPGECRGYPNCHADFEGCDGKAESDTCEIAVDFHQGPEAGVREGRCVTFSFDDADEGEEFLTCDLGAVPAGGDEGDEEEGCSTAPGQTGSLAALFAAAGLFLLRRRS